MWSGALGSLAVGTALAVTATTPPSPTTAAVTAAKDGPTRGSSPVRAWTISPALDRGGQQSPRSGRIATRPFRMVAVTWQGAAGRDHLVRTRSRAAGWTDWRPLLSLHEDAPDPDTREARRRTVSGSQPLWVGAADGVQVRARAGATRDLEVVLIDPGSRPADHEGGPAVRSAGLSEGAGVAGGLVTVAASTVSGESTGSVPRPALRFRHDWGADESLRDGDPFYTSVIKQGHVHHTAGTNSYTRSDVPAIIRGMYAYHTRSLGWSDIGYNFLVDRFGRIWVGRAGGPRRNVRGAHTLGFNHQSFGVAAIGTFEEAGPPTRMVRGIARLSAWKLDIAGRRPAGRVWTTSRGSDRYASGTRVQLPVLDGHRDTNRTACPGAVLYTRLPVIRRRAQSLVDGAG